MREVLISSGVLILVLAALRRLLRGRISLSIQYALWLLVAVRLLVPVPVGHSAISVLNLTNRAAALSRRDGELSCDEGAVRRLGEEERLAYGRTQVDLVTQGRIPLLQTATTMAEKRSGLRERVALLVSRPRTLAAAAVCLLLVVCLTVGCTFTGAEEAKTLQERLLDLPEELAEVVEVEEEFEDPDHLVSYHAAASGGLWGGALLWREGCPLTKNGSKEQRPGEFFSGPLGAWLDVCITPQGGRRSPYPRRGR